MKMNHVGIMVGDMDKAVEFYTKALGLKNCYEQHKSHRRARNSDWQNVYRSIW
ncbi:lactoylglutathione lyase [Vibrio variabilis]|uniref:Lactoylglutathione lyase n=1 Tax=Vibrio variabilis TaxID=990271 RepID=A0ABQ0JPH3_9VIBR|nr:lactoylglutathione lyase [Vibrio variabilis]